MRGQHSGRVSRRSTAPSRFMSGINCSHLKVCEPFGTFHIVRQADSSSAPHLEFQHISLHSSTPPYSGRSKSRRLLAVLSCTRATRCMPLGSSHRHVAQLQLHAAVSADTTDMPRCVPLSLCTETCSCPEHGKGKRSPLDWIVVVEQ